jgi:hypothetical protein
VGVTAPQPVFTSSRSPAGAWRGYPQTLNGKDRRKPPTQQFALSPYGERYGGIVSTISVLLKATILGEPLPCCRNACGRPVPPSAPAGGEGGPKSHHVSWTAHGLGLPTEARHQAHSNHAAPGPGFWWNVNSAGGNGKHRVIGDAASLNVQRHCHTHR